MNADQPYSFSEKLAQSHAASDLPFWEEAYRKAFPDMVAMVDHRQDGPHQRAGIDRSIILANSKQILVDEKVRYRNEKTGKVYRDIALEYWSDRDRRIRGWVCKPLLADYIAYAIAPLGICYMLPVIQLQSAWTTYGPKWANEYPKIKTQNSRWITMSLGVPADVVLRAVTNTLLIEFKAAAPALEVIE